MDKLFYRIGEVSKLTGVVPYILRYWESEFSFLKPRKNNSGQRVYLKKDIELILEIKKLLYEERYTIEGVKKKFARESKDKHRMVDINKIRNDLKEVLKLISD